MSKHLLILGAGFSGKAIGDVFREAGFTVCTMQSPPGFLQQGNCMSAFSIADNGRTTHRHSGESRNPVFGAPTGSRLSPGRRCRNMMCFVKRIADSGYIRAIALLFSRGRGVASVSCGMLALQGNRHALLACACAKIAYSCGLPGGRLLR